MAVFCEHPFRGFGDIIEMHEAFAGQALSTIRAIESREWCKNKLGLDQPFPPMELSLFQRPSADPNQLELFG